MAGNKRTSLETLAVHAGREIDDTGAVAPPLHLSSTFARDPSGELMSDSLYGRYGNPTRDRTERALAALEGAEGALTVASGCAVAHLLLSTLSQGDQLVVSADMYFGIRRLLAELCAQFGIGFHPVDLNDEATLEARLAEGATMLLCESPTNPLMHVVDIAALADRCHERGVTFVVDNTMATSILQRPLELGADLVMHSSTKYLSGHSDLIGGVILCHDASHPLWSRLLELRKITGAVPSPFDCWLLLRSLATLVLRVERQTDNAEELAPWLATHPAVERVLYPGLPDHPQFDIAERQMRRPGAMLSLLVRGGLEGGRRFTGALELIVRATSLGAVHSLAEHRKVVEGPDSATPNGLVRLSIGIEGLDDLRADLKQALDKA